MGLQDIIKERVSGMTELLTASGFSEIPLSDAQRIIEYPKEGGPLAGNRLQRIALYAKPIPYGSSAITFKAALDLRNPEYPHIIQFTFSCEVPHYVNNESLTFCVDNIGRVIFPRVEEFSDLCGALPTNYSQLITENRIPESELQKAESYSGIRHGANWWLYAGRVKVTEGTPHVAEFTYHVAFQNKDPALTVAEASELIKYVYDEVALLPKYVNRMLDLKTQFAASEHK